MKIFCLTCKKHVLDTTETFVCGGPYNGTMFKSSQGMPPYAKYPKHVGVVKKNLQCPWCSAPFLGVSDELLTEHGKIKAGQKTYDPDFSIVWQEGPAKGKLMYIKDAPEKIGNFYFDEDEKQSVVDAIAIPTASELIDRCPDLKIPTPEFDKFNDLIKDRGIKGLEVLSKSVEKRIEIQSEGDPRKLKTYELKDKGFNNTQIAKEVGVSGVTVGKWLKDRK